MLQVKDITDRLFQGDSTNDLKKIPSESIDLIVTSPPYADNRRKTYKGFTIKDYVNL